MDADQWHLAWQEICAAPRILDGRYGTALRQEAEHFVSVAGDKMWDGFLEIRASADGQAQLTGRDGEGLRIPNIDCIRLGKA